LIAELINLDKDKFDNSTALEICAGGRLYNVVVENEIIGSQLLDKGQLRRRWTLIPLNKIQAFKASAERIATAQRLAPGKVDLALSLVGYDREVQTAMEWVFGNTLICKDAEAAKRVTFDKNVRMKSVTIDGDVYDPFGTLSGGSKPNSAGILVRVQELNQVRQQIRRHKETLAKVDQELTNSQRVISDYKRRKQMLDLKSHEIHLLEERLRQSTHSQVSVAKRSACPPCRLLIASILPIFLSS
jgi:structural maintenance of chromosome 2